MEGSDSTPCFLHTPLSGFIYVFFIRNVYFRRENIQTQKIFKCWIVIYLDSLQLRMLNPYFLLMKKLKFFDVSSPCFSYFRKYEKKEHKKVQVAKYRLFWILLESETI